MRVLQLGKFYPIRGGVEKVMWELTRGLVAQGVASDMLCARFKADGPDLQDAPLADGFDFCFGPQNRVFCVPALAKIAGTMLSPAMINWLRKHAGTYDIIHIHHPDPMAAVALRFSGYKGKVVLHWHSDILSQKWLFRLYRPLQGWLIRRANVIVGTTPVYLQESVWLRDVQPKCRCIPIGLDPLKPDSSRSSEVIRKYQGKRLLLSVGRMVPYKGFRYLIDAMPYLPEEYHLVLVGGGPLREKLETQVRAMGLEHRVSMPGSESDERLLDYYGACEVFVLPSVLRTEAFGIVQIEAMSCGKPVVATRIPGSGVSWVNEDGVSGKNAEPMNPQSLAQAILAVEADYERFSQGARKRYESLFKKETMINQTKLLYEELC